MIKNKMKAPSFNDGTVLLYSVENIAEKGNKPIDRLTLKYSLRYGRRIVGNQRFYIAKQAQVNINHVVRCLERPDVSVQDIAVLDDGRQYNIRQVQYPPDISPRVMDLSLEEVETPYEIN